ncbi:MAG: polysaccharide deacetylase family protein [Clostridia bacterium]|nr:polysaccharide deacetylase family protein [Clostridia bacterium]
MTKSKILKTSLAVGIILLLLTCLVTTVIIATTSDPVVACASIEEKNVEYRDLLHLAFTVSLTEDAPVGNAGIIMWEDDVTAYKVSNACYSCFNESVDPNGKIYYAGPGIPAKEMGKVYKVSAAVKTDTGIVIASEPEDFSVELYANERLSDLLNIYESVGYLTAEEINQKNLYEKLLAYGGIASDYFEKNPSSSPSIAKVLPVKGGANGIVVLMLDDGRIDSAKITDEVLQKYGIVADAAIHAAKLYTGENINATLNEELVSQWQELFDTGRWKLTSHSLTHDMTEYNNSASMENEVVKSQDILRSIFDGQKVLTFAYPGKDSLVQELGVNNVYGIMKELVSKTYIAGRYCRGTEYDPDKGTWTVTVGSGELKVDEENDWYFHPATTSSINKPDTMLNKVALASNGYVQVLFQHGVVEDADYDNNTYYVTRTYMENLCAEIKKYVDNGTIWNTSYEDAILYLREAETATITGYAQNDSITLNLTDEMDDTIYNHALTVRVNIPAEWQTVKVTQNGVESYATAKTVEGKHIVDVDIVPDAGKATVVPVIYTDDTTLESEYGTVIGENKVDTNYYPGFVRKAVTFTIDDGNITNDTKFLNIVKPAGILGTFNLINTDSLTDQGYTDLYKGYEVANHHRLHCLPMLDDFNFDSIEKKDEIFNSETADTDYVYKTNIEGLYYVDYHYINPAYTAPYWHPIATNDTYTAYINITEDDLESIFGEGTVVGFAYPHGKLSTYVKQYLKDNGYLYARKTGCIKDSTGFALPSDRYEWSYNADVSCLNDVMAAFDALADDGNLKFFSFGVHSGDFNGQWEVLETFADTYGNRPKDFYYASNRDIFEYEDAVKALVITDEGIVNNSDIAVYVTINNVKTVISANSEYKFN